MIQFYAPDIETEPILPEGESAHCARVLRMKEGDEISVTDGKGNRYHCVITKSHHARTQVEIIRKERQEPERAYHLTVAIAPTKNSDRIEWFVEKAVEIGVDRIVLLKCGRSERKVQKSERLERVIVSAMKQSLSSYKPELTDLIGFKEFVTGIEPSASKYFGYCSEAYPRKEFAKECNGEGEIVVMIGPEGDFTQEEVAMAVENGFLPVTFGEKRLRTETAGVYAVCAVSTINQRLK